MAPVRKVSESIAWCSSAARISDRGQAPASDDRYNRMTDPTAIAVGSRTAAAPLCPRLRERAEPVKPPAAVGQQETRAPQRREQVASGCADRASATRCRARRRRRGGIG